MKTFYVLPWLVALIAGLHAMPALNIFKICAHNAGTLNVDPWRIRAGSVLRSATQTIRAWLASLWTPRLAFACLAVLLAVLAAQLGAGHGGLLLAIGPIATVETLQAQRATLLREAEAFRTADGKYKDDAARTSFDAKMAEVDAVDAQIRTAQAAPAAPTVDSATRATVVKEEQTRVLGIQEAVRFAKLEPAVAEELVRSGVTLDAARSQIFQKLAAASTEMPTRSSVTVGEDALDKWVRGATNWLLHKSGAAGLVARHQKVELSALDAGEFRGLSLLELARQSLIRGGHGATGLDKMRLVGDALTARGSITQSTSDFAVLLENVQNKILLAAYAVTPDTWRRFCITGTVNDFRASNRYRMGSFGSLDVLTEAGEFKNKSISDAEKQTITAATKGNIINITRQMIVNDDMSAFGRLPQMFGRAAGLSVEVDVYALLALNAGLGPVMSDGLTLFHATHANVGAGSALTAAAIDANRVVMAQQKDKDGNEFIDMRPSILLINVGLGGQARVINQSQYDPDNIANKAQMRPNVVVGLFRDVVDSPRVAGTRRYLFADPDIAPTLEVAFLEGQSSPVLETKDGWRVDGAEMKVRFDYGVGAIDFRTAVTDLGA